MSLDLSSPIPRAKFAAVIGVSRAAVNEMVNRGVLPARGNCGQWLIAYTAHLREIAAGRSGGGALDGALDLVAERARLASEQADHAAMKNAILRREWAPVTALQEALARVCTLAARRFDAIVPELRLRCPGIDLPELEAIESLIAAARNEVADAQIDLSDLAPQEQEEDADPDHPPGQGDGDD